MELMEVLRNVKKEQLSRYHILRIDEKPLIARHERSRLVESHFDINMSSPYFMMLITQIARKPSKGRQI